MKLERTVRFKKDWKRMKKRGVDLSKLNAVLQILLDGQPLPVVYRDHALLSGEYKGVHDVHIEPDWILLYEMRGETLILFRTGTHSDLSL
ncbi:MAG: type II toxin-antitoxin system YafQ family toxin [Oscillibacter sp.]|nr:type II toxin-antitoxin system YafQ family toxin [Oscillibacter sp.]